ncbi:MAG: phosphoribosylanthranilate isomerase [Pseudomonadota bacterium]
MTMDIKICGLSTKETISAVAENGGTHAGFIFFEKSPRNVSVALAADLMAHAESLGLKTVAVTVDADSAFLDEIVSVAKPQILQLHGKETPERVNEVKVRHTRETWKAFSVSHLDDLAKLDAYRGITDRFLLDAKPPKGSDLPGGNAVSFDWSILTKMPTGMDYLLSGGVDADNVTQAIAAGAPALDLSSGVESGPGVKDIGKIKAFFKAVAAA